MDRRQFLGALGSAGVVATAGCSALRTSTTLSDPTVHTDSSQRRSLRFTANGTEVGSFGASGSVTGGVIQLSTEIWHRDGTNVKSMTLRVWMQPADAATRVALVSPVEGDSSQPPTVALYTPQRGPGTVIEVTDLDDLKDETISCLDLMVRPGAQASTTLTIEPTIELAGGGVFGRTYTLQGQLQLEFPELTGQ